MESLQRLPAQRIRDCNERIQGDCQETQTRRVLYCWIQGANDTQAESSLQFSRSGKGKSTHWTIFKRLGRHPWSVSDCRQEIRGDRLGRRRRKWGDE